MKTLITVLMLGLSGSALALDLAFEEAAKPSLKCESVGDTDSTLSIQFFVNQRIDAAVDLKIGEDATFFAGTFNRQESDVLYGEETYNLSNSEVRGGTLTVIKQSRCGRGGCDVGPAKIHALVKLPNFDESFKCEKV